MESVEVGELFSNIDAAIEEEEFERGLHLIVANFEALADPAPLRERTAALFAADGREEEAVEIYQRVGSHYLNAGHPARVIAIVKKIEALGKSPTELLDRFTALYNARSPFLDRMRRHAAFGAPEGEVTVDADDVDAPDGDPFETAGRMALEEGDFVEEPPDDLPPLPVLSRYPSDDLKRVVHRLEHTTYDDLTQISGPGVSRGQLLWTISSDVTIGEKDPTYRLRPGSLLGLHRLGQSPVSGEQEVYARSGSELLALSDDAVDELSANVDGFREALDTVARRSFIEGLLESHAMFDVLPKDDREAFLSEFVGLKFEAGTPLIDQGSESPGLFVILEGEVDIVRKDEDWEITVETLGAGDVVGEVGLVSDRPAQADVVVTEAGHVLHLPAESFESVASQHPELAKWTVGLAQERMEDLESTLSAQDLAEISE